MKKPIIITTVLALAVCMTLLLILYDQPNTMKTLSYSVEPPKQVIKAALEIKGQRGVLQTSSLHTKVTGALPPGGEDFLIEADQINLEMATLLQDSNISTRDLEFQKLIQET